MFSWFLSFDGYKSNIFIKTGPKNVFTRPFFELLTLNFKKRSRVCLIFCSSLHFSSIIARFSLYPYLNSICHQNHNRAKGLTQHDSNSHLKTWFFFTSWCFHRFQINFLHSHAFRVNRFFLENKWSVKKYLLW